MWRSQPQCVAGLAAALTAFFLVRPDRSWRCLSVSRGWSIRPLTRLDLAAAGGEFVAAVGDGW